MSIELSEIRKGRGTAVQFDRQIEQDTIARRAGLIAQQIEGNDSVVCYVFGMGAQPRSTYASVAKMDGVKVLWNISVLPRKWRWLNRIVASEAGLVKIEKASALVEVFSKVVHSAMAAIYVLPQSAEQMFVTEVRNNPTPADYGFGATDRDDYFIYMVDADSRESSTGVFEIVSYGRDPAVRLTQNGVRFTS